MGECQNCEHWVVAKEDRYGDGTTIVRAKIQPEGNGECQQLKIETKAAFGCNAFALGDEHIQITLKTGSPWQHFVMGPCPDCRGNGSSGGACRRCAGTGLVRFYDDGHVGEEQTRRHPKEIELGQVPPLKCGKCSAIVQTAWVACPMCGNRLMPPAETEVIDDAKAGLP